ncbi:hypothetical protein Unana1_05431 [Umbelopsis nana]
METDAGWPESSEVSASPLPANFEILDQDIQSFQALVSNYHCRQCDTRRLHTFRGSVSDKDPANDSNTIDELRKTIKTLQQTINQMASLIAELTPLRTTVSNLKKRIAQLENPAAAPVSNEPKVIPSDTPPSSNLQSPNAPPAKANLWFAVVKMQHRPPTKARLATSATITFQAPPNINKHYETNYISARHRITKVMARQKLRALGIQTHRVVDIHFPATATVAMLVHEDYGVEVKRILGERKITILPFDPLDPSHLKTPNTNISRWSRKGKKLRTYKKPGCLERFDL